MSHITLSPITSGCNTVSTLNIHVHVHNRTEYFSYLADIESGAVALDYLETDSINSSKNIWIEKLTYLIPENNNNLLDEKSIIVKTDNVSYMTTYNNILATNKVIIDDYGIEVPLFYKHKLPIGTVECKLYSIENGTNINVSTGYKIDLEEHHIYTNFTNYYDNQTGSYKFYFVVYTDAEGVSVNCIFNPEPTAILASWEDIDQTTGLLTEDYPLYTIESSSSGYLYTFNQSGPWYIKQIDTSLIQPFVLPNRTPEEPWYLSITAGQFKSLVNDSVRDYSVPEYNYQSFTPSKPYMFSPYEKVILIDNRYLKTSRNRIKIKPDEGLQIELYIYNSSKELIRIFTTDVSKDGMQYNSSVSYEADAIDSWDENLGIICLNKQLHPDQYFVARYYYESIYFEDNRINLNPLFNKEIVDLAVVHYLIPDVAYTERAVQYILLNRAGIIVDASQAYGYSYENLQLRDELGAYNANTIIGDTYNNFVSNYCSGQDNEYGYMLLSKLTIIDYNIIGKEKVYSVRNLNPGPILDEITIKKNCKIPYSINGYGILGEEIPKNAAVVIEAPITLLEDYGGIFTQEYAEKLLTKHLNAAVYPVIKWVGETVVLEGYANSNTTITLTWKSNGQTTLSNIYRKQSNLENWIFLDNVYSVNGDEQIEYIDTDIIANEYYQYAIKLVIEDVEHPFSNLVLLRAR